MPNNPSSENRNYPPMRFLIGGNWYDSAEKKAQREYRDWCLSHETDDNFSLRLVEELPEDPPGTTRW